MRGENVWHAHKDAGGWVDARRLGTNAAVGSFIASSHPKLLDGNLPGLIAVWSEPLSNGVQLVYSVGRMNGGAFQFSEPKQLTEDAAQSFSPAIAVRDDGLAVITYLKMGFVQRDDTDVYYSIVSLDTGNLIWSGPAPLAEPRARSVGIDQNGFSLAYGNDFNFNVGGDEVGFGYEFKATGLVSGCTASAEGSAAIKASYTGGQVAVSGGGAIKMKYNWQMNPDACAMEFQSAVASAEANMHVDLRNAAARILGSLPHPAPRAVARTLDSMTDWLRRWGYLVENTVGFGVGLSLEDVTWDHEPGPITSWRAPDSPGQTILTLDCAIKLSARTLGANEELISGLANGQQYDYVTRTEDDVGEFVGVEGEAKIEAKWKVYPQFALKSVGVGGSFKISLAPYFSWSFPLPEGKYEIESSAVPLDTGLEMPEGWIFSYDPIAFIGTTNIQGANAILSSVGSDLFQDGAPAITLDGAGTPYQVWYKFRDPRSGEAGSELVSADFNGASWSAPVVIPGSLGINSYVCTAVDSSDTRVAVWVRADSGTVSTNMTFEQFLAVRDSAEVVFSEWDGSSWTLPQALAATPGPDRDLKVTRLDNGQLLATWVYTETNSFVVLVASTWNGTTWSKPETVATGDIEEASLAQTGASLHALITMRTGTNQSALFAVEQSAGVWSAPTAFVPALAAPSVAPLVSHTVPRVSDSDLAALYDINERERDACCKCTDRLRTIESGRDQGCGRTSDTYDYTNCIRYINYKACPRRASDPNDIVGPEGFGPERWVTAHAPLHYMIRFENDPVLADAPAKQVTITLPIHENFDPRTFRLGSFGFGEFTFPVPTNSAFYQTRLDLVASNGFYLDVFAGVDVAAREAFWTLTTIDPVTGGIPIDPDVGFLPVNTNSPIGEGFANFSVLPRQNLGTGVEVAEAAVIVFDNQPPIATPAWTNRLQYGAPSSEVLPFAGATTDPVIPVVWVGVPATNGPGIEGFDIYVSQDGTGFYPWLEGTTLNEAVFQGTPGSSYEFYSVARDFSGNIEGTPASADAQIFISTNTAPAMGLLTNVVAAPDTRVVIRASASDAENDSISFSLAGGGLPGSTINPTNGLFRWDAPRSYAGTTNLVGIVITDAGAPQLSSTGLVSIAVLDYLEAALGTTNLMGGETSKLPLRVESSKGMTNLLLTLEADASVLGNWTLDTSNPAISSAAVEENGSELTVRLTLSPGMVITNADPIAWLGFTASDSQVSRFVPVKVTAISANRPSGAEYGAYMGVNGSVTVVQEQPLLQIVEGTGQGTIRLYGQIGKVYILESATSLGGGWTTVVSYTQTEAVMEVDVPEVEPPVFYRLREEGA
jgi:hypothetical protein